MIWAIVIIVFYVFGGYIFLSDDGYKGRELQGCLYYTIAFIIAAVIIGCLGYLIDSASMD